MSPFGHLVRQATLAALALLPLPAAAEPVARFDAATGRVVVTGLDDVERETVLTEPERLRLRIEDAASERGMLVALEAQPEALIVAPRFALRPGTRYRLDLSLPHEDVAVAFDLPARSATAPEVTGFTPSQAVIPANTLRLYVQFSEPMARGQLRQAVRLMRADGSAVNSPFLNLETELWDPGQTRATLLLDPGRIKQGVGPNARAGAPLEEGASYRLVVSGDMKSASGAPIGDDIAMAFRAGPPERRAIAATDWRVDAPAAGTLAPLSVSFDRIMDSGAVRRLLAVEDPDGTRVAGRITTDGGGWALIPDTPWKSGYHTLRVDPDLEDVAGNTVSAPFDASAGTMGMEYSAVSLSVQIR